MTCNAVLKQVDKEQEEWTPYKSFSNHNFKKLVSSFSFDWGLAKPDTLKNSFVRTNATDETLCFTRQDLTWPYSANGTMQENCCIKDWKFLTSQTNTLWDNLMNTCDKKRRIHWADLLENRRFLCSLGVTYKEKPVVEDNSIWDFKCCECSDKRDQKRTLRENPGELSEESYVSEEECSSPCCCPKFFISEHGVVFSSAEEKQIFDNKMAMMDKLLKFELRTIREQHDRLQQIHLKSTVEESDEDMSGEQVKFNEPTKKGGLDIDQSDLTFREEEQEQRTHYGIFNSFKGLINNFNWTQDVSDRQKECLVETSSKNVHETTNQLCDKLISTLKEMEAKLE